MNEIGFALLNALIEKGLCDPGATGPQTRWARLPNAINGKVKYVEAGQPFQCRLAVWRPDLRYTVDQVVDKFQLELAPAGKPKKAAAATANSIARDSGASVLTPKAPENPVVTALKARGLYKRPLAEGKHEVTCPWAHEHTDGLDSGSAYFEPSAVSPVGGYCCQHSHREDYRIGQLVRELGLTMIEARHKAVIRVLGGDLDGVVDAAEQVLARGGEHYQSGSGIVRVDTHAVTGDPFIVQLAAPSLARALSEAAIWEKPGTKADAWVAIDPPERHVSVLLGSGTFAHLPALAGLVRQPYFRESDGALVTQPGYDHGSKLFGAFDPDRFVVPEPTLANARASLQLLDDLLSEFPFVAEHDRAAALSAIFTGVVRSCLPNAPGFHVRAPVISSGKSYLCEVIGACASDAPSKKISYPVQAEEATKEVLAALLEQPAVLEFDDMATDWIPHGSMNRLLTAGQISDRVLGSSKMATVSTRVLVLGSGNNVGPIRDLVRRVISIHLDPRSATPATREYEGRPLEKVRANRSVYVAAVLCVIQAWRLAGAPLASVKNIATYGGAWADHCRHPLMWLGLPDPATALLEQLTKDPDAEALGAMLTAWWDAFGNRAMTIRKVLADDCELRYPDLYDAMRELQLEERGNINRSKLGRQLKRTENRIVGGLQFQKTQADGRTAWRVVAVGTPPSPPSPPTPAPELEFEIDAAELNADSTDDEIPY